MEEDDSWRFWLWAALVLTVWVRADGTEIDPILGCHIRNYTYHIDKPYETEDGQLLACQGDVTVRTCWGRCDTHEIADYKIPYKLSSHPVCSYGEHRPRKHRLSNCHPAHPEPETEVFDAISCVCKTCTHHDTSCESMHGS